MMKAKSSFYCWFHTLEKVFIPAIKELSTPTIHSNIISVIRKIYCSKTLEARAKNVDILLEILKEEKKLKQFFETGRYLEEEVLDLWTSLYKFSQYADHSSNYLERFFGRVSFFYFLNF